MNTKIFFTIFFTVFFAELGDKTQLATLLFATNKDHSKMLVFIAAALALVLTSAIAVIFGQTINKHLNTKYLSWIAGAGFILVGVWTIVRS